MQKIASTVGTLSPPSAESTIVVPVDRSSIPSAPPLSQGSYLVSRAISAYANLAKTSSMAMTTTLLTIQMTIKHPSTIIATRLKTSTMTICITRSPTTPRLAHRQSAYLCRAKMAVRRSAGHTSSKLVLRLLPGLVRHGLCDRSVEGHARQAINAIIQNISTCVTSNTTIERHFTSICTTTLEANLTCLPSIMTTSSILTLRLSCQMTVPVKKSNPASLPP